MTLFERFQNWLENKNLVNRYDIDEEFEFNKFFDKYSDTKAESTLLSEIAYQIYQLQVCVEGILLDLDGESI